MAVVGEGDSNQEGWELGSRLESLAQIELTQLWFLPEPSKIREEGTGSIDEDAGAWERFIREGTWINRACMGHFPNISQGLGVER